MMTKDVASFQTWEGLNLLSLTSTIIARMQQSMEWFSFIQSYQKTIKICRRKRIQPLEYRFVSPCCEIRRRSWGKIFCNTGILIRLRKTMRINLKATADEALVVKIIEKDL